MVEEEKKWHANVMTIQVKTAAIRYYIVGCYLLWGENYQSTFAHVKKAWEQCPKGSTPLLVGDLNVDIDDPRDGRFELRDETIIEQVVSHWNLTNIMGHFKIC